MAANADRACAALAFAFPAASTPTSVALTRGGCPLAVEPARARLLTAAGPGPGPGPEVTTGQNWTILEWHMAKPVTITGWAFTLAAPPAAFAAAAGPGPGPGPAADPTLSCRLAQNGSGWQVLLSCASRVFPRPLGCFVPSLSPALLADSCAPSAACRVVGCVSPCHRRPPQ